MGNIVGQTEDTGARVTPGAFLPQGALPQRQPSSFPMAEGTDRLAALVLGNQSAASLPSSPTGLQNNMVPRAAGDLPLGALPFSPMVALAANPVSDIDTARAGMAAEKLASNPGVMGNLQNFLASDEGKIGLLSAGLTLLSSDPQETLGQSLGKAGITGLNTYYSVAKNKADQELKSKRYDAKTKQIEFENKLKTSKEVRALNKDELAKESASNLKSALGKLLKDPTAENLTNILSETEYLTADQQRALISALPKKEGKKWVEFVSGQQMVSGFADPNTEKVNIIASGSRYKPGSGGGGAGGGGAGSQFPKGTSTEFNIGMKQYNMEYPLDPITRTRQEGAPSFSEFMRARTNNPAILRMINPTKAATPQAAAPAATAPQALQAAPRPKVDATMPIKQQMLNSLVNDYSAGKITKEKALEIKRRFGITDSELTSALGGR
jgi:uncharacterized protein YbcI